MNNSCQIHIIGKNSKLSKSFLNYSIINGVKLGDLYSYKEIEKIKYNDDGVFLLFSLSDIVQENISIIESLVNKNIKILIIGSASIISPRAEKFKYSKLKKRQMEAALAKGNNVLCGLFGSFVDPNKNGTYYKSEFHDILKAVDEINDGIFGVQLYARKISNKESWFVGWLYLALEKTIGIKLAAFIYKFGTRSVYGYSRVDYE